MTTPHSLTPPSRRRSSLMLLSNPLHLWGLAFHRALLLTWQAILCPRASPTKSSKVGVVTNTAVSEASFLHLISTSIFRPVIFQISLKLFHRNAGKTLSLLKPSLGSSQWGEIDWNWNRTTQNYRNVAEGWNNNQSSTPMMADNGRQWFIEISSRLYAFGSTNSTLTSYILTS